MDKHLYDIFAEKWQSDNKQVFFYSDTHFGDLECYTKRGQLALNLVAYGNTSEIVSEIAKFFQNYSNKIISAEDYVKFFDELQIKNINKRCGKASTFVCLGDVGNIECVKKLRPRYKVLILGNHDAGKTIYEQVFNEVYDGELLISSKLLLSHVPVFNTNKINLHGHDHCSVDQFNMAAESIGYVPVSLNEIVATGKLKTVDSLNRKAIDRAVARKKAKN